MVSNCRTALVVAVHSLPQFLTRQKIVDEGAISWQNKVMVCR